MEISQSILLSKKGKLKKKNIPLSKQVTYTVLYVFWDIYIFACEMKIMPRGIQEQQNPYHLA